MHKQIYFNCDSFSEGDVYLDSPTLCWPYQIIGNGFNLINDSLGGGSNYRIVRTSVKSISERHTDIHCAIFAWTAWTRYEIPGDESYQLQFHSTTNEETLIENFIDQINTIEKFCRAINVTYWHMNSFCNPYETIFDDQLTQERINGKLNSLDARHWIFPPNTSIIEWATKEKLSFTECGHLTADSNKILGQLIKQKIYK